MTFVSDPPFCYMGYWWPKKCRLTPRGCIRQCHSSKSCWPAEKEEKKNLDCDWLDYLVLSKAKNAWHSDRNTTEPITENSGLFCRSWVMKLHYPTIRNQLWNINRPLSPNNLPYYNRYLWYHWAMTHLKNMKYTVILIPLQHKSPSLFGLHKL